MHVPLKDYEPRPGGFFCIYAWNFRRLRVIQVNIHAKNPQLCWSILFKAEIAQQGPHL